MAPSLAVLDRDTLLESLRGQRIEVPDLSGFFKHWPARRNPHYFDVIPEVNKKLESLIKEPKKLEKMKSADFALFAAHWWPNADLEDLRICAFVAIWLFVWDDDIDEMDGVLSNNYDAAQEHRRQTVAYIEKTLGLNVFEDDFIPSSPIIRSFGVIGEALSAAYNPDQRKTFMKEMLFFMDMSELEQKRKLRNEIPTLEEYWECRMGTSACGVTTAMCDFSNKAPSCLAAQNASVIWDNTNMIISITNDIFSLKKEIKGGCIESAIPIAVATHGSPQRAIDDAVVLLHELIIDFEEDAQDFLSQLDNEEDRRGVRAFIDGCKLNCTGNLNWSLNTGRYGVKNSIRSDGSVVFVL